MGNAAPVLCRGGGMADAADLKSSARKGVWVRIPPSVPVLCRFNKPIDPSVDLFWGDSFCPVKKSRHMVQGWWMMPLFDEAASLAGQIGQIGHETPNRFPVAVKVAAKHEEALDFSRASSISTAIWRRRADSNRRIEVLQTSALNRLATSPLHQNSRLVAFARSKFQSGNYMVPRAGLEPARPYEHYALNVACLPISAPRHG